MSSPEGSPTPILREPVGAATRDYEIRDAARREALWLKLNTALLAMLFGLLAFFGRDLYSDVKTHTAQLAAITAQLATLSERVSGNTDRMNDLKERENSLENKVDKIAADTEQNGRSLAEIKGFLQAMPRPSSKDGGSDSSRQ